jgi:hypothetical protein
MGGQRKGIGMPERPVELIYALDERPPWLQLLGLGFQHVAVICPYLVMVAEAAKLPREAAQSAVGLAMIAVAGMTVLQSLRLGQVGSGYLCPPVVSAIYLPSSLAIRVIGRVRDGDVRRRLRVWGGVPHQPDTKTVSSRGFGRGHHRRRPGTRKDRNQRAVRACSRASRSRHWVVRHCRFHPHGDDGPGGLGQGIAQAVLFAAGDTDGLVLGQDATPATAGAFNLFFEKQAREWKIPGEDAARVRSVVDTAIEYVTANANGPVEIQMGSDTFDILVTLRYTGNLPSLPDARPKKEMVEEQSFVSGLSGYLSGLHADRVERSAKGEQCEIKLLFRL